MTISEQPAKNHAVNRLEKEITLERNHHFIAWSHPGQGHIPSFLPLNEVQYVDCGSYCDVVDVLHQNGSGL